ncbi:NAD(P)-binding protein [Panus rudis PR-1116 ss-1]|nr:NAD(P)-binding protein [Panus rudis PR-1116 ss-1]
MSSPNISDSKCVLVLGATSGIGRALALAIHDLPSQPTVIVGGRRKERLEELASRSDRLYSVQIDITSDRESLKKFVEDLVTKYPDLETVVFSSGVQHIFDFTKPEDINLDVLQAEFQTNYLSIVTLITLLLPHFLKLSNEGHPSFIVPITSALAMVPLARVINYSATKAALHSFCLSLSAQLQKTNVHVIEIMPPLVESELHDHQGTTPHLSKFWMPLNEFTEKALSGLKRGDIAVPVGDAVEKWETFEKGKFERVLEGNRPLPQ